MSASALQAALIDHLCKVWQEPDQGIWEVRGGAETLYALEGDGVGGAGSCDQDTMQSMTGAGDVEAMEEESRHDPSRGLREGVRQKTE